MHVRWRRLAAGTVILSALAASGAPAFAQTGGPPSDTGRSGAAASIDRTATVEMIRALRRGASAVDAAVVGAGVLGVTDPLGGGIGGGGFMVLYRADRQRVTTIDGREEAPEAFHPTVFMEDGRPIPFGEAVYSGLSAGVPGTLATWEEALRRYGKWSLARALEPGTRVALRGFEVDEAFRADVAGRVAAFNDFTTTRDLYLGEDGEPPRVGSRFRNPGLARAYALIARRGIKAFYDGPIADAIVDTVRNPPLRPGATRNVRPGLMTLGDLDDYQAIIRRPTRVDYRGLEVYGMAPPSSGGSTIGEALNILEGYDLGAMPREAALHRYIEASKLAFADRGAYLGDPEYFDVPLRGLLSDAFAAERRSLIGEQALPTPQGPGDPWDEEGDPSPSGPRTAAGSATLSRTGSTTHLTVSDRRGNVVAYTFTIEQRGGNGMVVPGYGFLLNNELTDFDFVPPHPNAPESGKRPRSSMSPTIVLRDGKPFLALGAPGGSTIITAVLQTLVNRIDLGMSFPEAVWAPRVSSRNFSPNSAEQAFIDSPEGQALIARGHQLSPSTGVGLVNGIEFGPGDRVTAAAERTRGGGGSAMTER